MKLIGSRIIYLAKTGSTNEYAAEFVKQNRPAEGTLIITENQTRGHGLGSNSWESKPGKNLTFSIILYPTFLPVKKQFHLNQSLSLGLAGFISSKLDDEMITIKWPNDIFINSKKVCGILIQNSVIGQVFEQSIVGIGVNINQISFSNSLPNAVSLKKITGKTYLLDELLADACYFLNERYLQLKAGDCNKLNDDYLQSLYQFGEWHEYLIRGSIHRAKISGIDCFGRLILNDEKGQDWICDLKEVQYL